MVMQTNEVIKILRQKFPFVYVDRIIDIDPGKSCTALKNVTYTEPCFGGHFPDEPIYPGVLIIESMAQAGGFLFFNEGVRQKGVIASINNTKFLSPVTPGDTMIIKSLCIATVGKLSKVSCTVLVNETIVAQGEINYIIENNAN